MQLLDTPGILWPKFEDPKAGLDLAFCGSIKDEILDTATLAMELIGVLSAEYPELLMERYKLAEISETPLATMEDIAAKRGFILPGKRIDYERCGRTVLDEFRSGKIGHITLERRGIPMTKAERTERLKERLQELQLYERELRTKGFRYVAGVDEVGRGPLAGPVVAAAVVLPEDFDVLGVDDSKKLTEKKREALYDEIVEKALCWGIGRRDNFVIDEVNILQATKLAMAEAIENAGQMLFDRTGEEIDFVLFDAMEIQAVRKPQMSLIKGDSKSVSIAAASIVAKVTRDREMIQLDQVYPGYGFASNKGYGTKAHYQGLRENGITSVHRRSFLKNFDVR